MSIGAIVAVVIAVTIVVAAVALAVAEMRRRGLRQRFGPEYERLVREKGARRAGSELAARQRLVAKLDIRSLTDEERAGYTRRWNVVQEQFVDDPAYSTHAASSLVTAVLKDRGFPADDGEQTMRALSVEHARALQDYRRAQQTTGDGISTEDLRQALLGYRRLFRELIGSANGLTTGSAPASAPARAQAPAPVPVPVPALVPAPVPVPAPVLVPASVRPDAARFRPASADTDEASDGSASADADADEASAEDTGADHEASGDAASRHDVAADRGVGSADHDAAGDADADADDAGLGAAGKAAKG